MEPHGPARDGGGGDHGGRPRARLLLCAVLLAVAAFQLATIRSGHPWSGDFSLYVAHAANLVEGRPYADTGYVYRPDGLSPRAYPPVYPMLLAPVYAVFGLDLDAFKIETVLLFVAMLWAVHRTFGRALPTGALLAVVALVGFNPYFTHLKSVVTAEIPFMLCLYLATAFLVRCWSEEEGWTRDPWRALLAGGLVSLAVGVKPIGLALAVSVVLVDLLRRRRISRFTWIASAIVAGFVVMERALFTGDTGQQAHFTVSLAQIASHLVEYLRDPPMTLLYGFARGWDSVALGRRWVATLLAAPVTLLALLGAVSRARRGVSVLEVLPVVYVGVLLLWPFTAPLRYMASLFPFYLYYAFVGIRSLGTARGGHRAAALTGVVTVAIACAYGTGHARADHGPFRSGVDEPEARALFEFIRTGTGEDAVVVFRKPRVLALYTGRKAAYDKRIVDDRGFADLLRSAGATHVVVGVLDSPERVEITRRSLGAAQSVFRNADFEVLRVPDDALP